MPRAAFRPARTLVLALAVATAACSPGPQADDDTATARINAPAAVPRVASEGAMVAPTWRMARGFGENPFVGSTSIVFGTGRPPAAGATRRGLNHASTSAMLLENGRAATASRSAG